MSGRHTRHYFLVIPQSVEEMPIGHHNPAILVDGQVFESYMQRRLQYFQRSGYKSSLINLNGNIEPLEGTRIYANFEEIILHYSLVRITETKRRDWLSLQLRNCLPGFGALNLYFYDPHYFCMATTKSGCTRMKLC